MPTRHECHRGNKEKIVPKARLTRLAMSISATRYPDRPRANKTIASPMPAAARAIIPTKNNIRAANRRPANNKSPVPRTANAYIS